MEEKQDKTVKEAPSDKAVKTPEQINVKTKDVVFLGDFKDTIGKQIRDGRSHIRQALNQGYTKNLSLHEYRELVRTRQIKPKGAK